MRDSLNHSKESQKNGDEDLVVRLLMDAAVEVDEPVEIGFELFHARAELPDD